MRATNVNHKSIFLIACINTLESGSTALLEDQVLVHVEHLFAVLVDGKESEGQQGSEHDRLPGIEQGPVLHLRKVAGEEDKAES